MKTHQFPVMQLQSFNYPKNVSTLPSPSLTTSSLINNNSLLTFQDIQDIMMHHHHHQQQQQQKQQQQNNERQQKKEILNENFQSISTNASSSAAVAAASSSPNTSVKLSPKHSYATDRNNMKVHHPLSVNKTEACENGSKISVNHSIQNKADSHHNSNSCGRTVREELEASRSKIPKLGELHENILFESL